MRAAGSIHRKTIARNMKEKGSNDDYADHP